MSGIDLICFGVLIIVAIVLFIRDPESFMGCMGCGFLIILILVVGSYIVGGIVVAGFMGFTMLSDFLSSIW